VDCLIVDDEELARRLIRTYAERLPGLRIVGEAPHPVAAAALLNHSPVDLLFLDIQMPRMSGLDFLRTQADPPAVILTTAYAKYAPEGYDLDVVDYLLKPYSFDRFAQAVRRAEERMGSRRHRTRVPAQTTYQLVKSEHKIFRLPHHDIRYIESMREYVAYHTDDGRRILSLGSLKQLERELPAGFMRVHKSYIVNTDRVDALEGNQLRLGEQRIPIGGSYRERVRQSLFGEG
jgi:DNA-binding LytR/AlgR family response regulator